VFVRGLGSGVGSRLGVDWLLSPRSSLNFTGFIVALPTVLDIYMDFVVFSASFGYCVNYIRNINPICSGSGREYPTIATFNCERTDHIFCTLTIPTI
jgi:hypothetical protein